ncbi:unnamed protein product [Symbiodinium microadriaticum]|nr:unnamed protein product [Symbiodinium microadriaticum]
MLVARVQESSESGWQERLAALSETPPLAVICIKSKEQLRWYVPVTAQVEPNQDVSALLSGKAATVEVGVDEEGCHNIETSGRDRTLGVGRGRLLDASGNVVASCVSITEARLQTGDWLTLHVSRVQVFATGRAFAAILGDGSVVAWGDPNEGGDSSAVQDQLRHVTQIQAFVCAFAAILGDGSVVTWGDPDGGGDSGAVRHLLKNVKQIQASSTAFAAILGDRSAVIWGNHFPRSRRALLTEVVTVELYRTSQARTDAMSHRPGKGIETHRAGSHGILDPMFLMLEDAILTEDCVQFETLVATIAQSEWNQLETEAARREYLRAAVSDYVAFTPSAVQADDIYR